MSEHKTTTSVTTEEPGAATIEWNIPMGRITAWESIRLEIIGEALHISSRSEGPVIIPLENLSVVMACIADLNAKFHATQTEGAAR